MNPVVQTLISISVPTFAVLIGILLNDSRLSDLRAEMARGFNQVDRQFDQTKELWRSELHRVEEILDARLKNVEQRMERLEGLIDRR